MSTEPCDLDFCRALPKIELHAHLHGSLRQSSIAELSGKPFPALSDSRDLTECFRIFDLIHNTVDTLNKVERLTREVLEDFKADNCIYLELRSTPRDRLNSWSKRQYLDCVTAVLLQWNQHEQMPVRLLLSIDRTTSLEEALSVVNLAEEYRGSTSGLIVGLDFCGVLWCSKLTLPCLNIDLFFKFVRQSYQVKLRCLRGGIPRWT
jgi:adenosine deaminase